MKILKLLKKAKNTHDLFLFPSFVYPSETEPGKWIADGRIGNKQGKYEVVKSVHDSVDDAIAVLEKYPTREGSSVIIVNDLKE